MSTDSSGDINCNAEKDGPQKLTNEQIGRYSRQLILPELGVKGDDHDNKIKETHTHVYIYICITIYTHTHACTHTHTHARTQTHTHSP